MAGDGDRAFLRRVLPTADLRNGDPFGVQVLEDQVTLIKSHPELGVLGFLGGTLLILVLIARENPTLVRTPDDNAQSLECSVDCPPGTRAAAFTVDEYKQGLREGRFVLTESSCESVCAPIEECLPPNVPRVTAAGFECTTIPGFSDIPTDVDTDLSFGTVWDPARAGVQPR